MDTKKLDKISEVANLTTLELKAAKRLLTESLKKDWFIYHNDTELAELTIKMIELIGSKKYVQVKSGQVLTSNLIAYLKGVSVAFNHSDFDYTDTHDLDKWSFTKKGVDTLALYCLVSVPTDRLYNSLTLKDYEPTFNKTNLKVANYVTDLKKDLETATEKKDLETATDNKTEQVNFKIQLFSIMDRYIAGGSPSDDTLKHYTAEIDNYLVWCTDNNLEPLKVDEMSAFKYLDYLNKSEFASASICLKITAARLFYFVAEKMKLVNINPFKDVRPRQPVYDDEDIDYLTQAELKEICDSIKARTDNTAKRDLAIVMLMAVEGCRTVEIHRMNDEDINWTRKTILIHGKGRDGYIYPCEDTFEVLKDYLDNRPSASKDENGTPTFIGVSKKFFGERISRNGIRWAINHILLVNGKKKKGSSCHTLRHSCGTNLYAETKDLRLVQETLRHSETATSARYAHIVDRAENRKTGLISPLN